MRLTTILLAAGVGLAPAGALAQNVTQPAATNTPAATTNAPATAAPPAGEAVGPRELQNFRLPGTTTRPADQPANRPATTAPSSVTSAPAADTSTSAPGPRRAVARATPRALPSRSRATITAEPTSLPPTGQAAPAPSSPTSLLPTASSNTLPAPISSGETAVSDRHLSFWPWLAAAIALSGGGLFLWLRRRPREAFAGVPSVQPFEAPLPAPAEPPLPRAPAPQPQARRATPEAPRPARPASPGIVASRLRPSLELAVHPLRCTLNDSEVVIEFEVEMLNSGSSPARAVFAEASLFNAGVGQEQDLEAFFAKSDSGGERLDRIEPLKSVMLTSRVVAPRASIQEYELAGRRSFVPLIAINALYEWGSGKGQTGAAFLIGRDSGAEKLGPLWLDTASHEISGLGSRLLPVGRQT